MAHRREQELFAGKAAVDRANAHTGAPRNLLHRHIRAAFGQQLVRRSQYTLKVTLGIFAFTALIRLDYIHWRSFSPISVRPLNGADSTPGVATILLFLPKRRWRSAFNEM